MNFGMMLSSIVSEQFWCDLYWKLHNLFFPKQRWLTKQIPRAYTDTADILRICIFGCLRNFVECEDGLLHLNTALNSAAPPDQEKYRTAILELSSAYDWLQSRAAFEAAIAETARDSRILEKEDERSAAVTAWAHAQEEYERREQLHMESIVRHSSLMWI